MHANMEGAAYDAEVLVEELEHTRDLDQKICEENETLKSQIERLIDDKRQAVDKCAELQGMLDALNTEKFDSIAHHNQKQKIHVSKNYSININQISCRTKLHVQLKNEFNLVLQENHKLKTKIAKLEEEIALNHGGKSAAVPEAIKENAKPLSRSLRPM